MDTTVIVEAFVVVVIGGMGSVWGRPARLAPHRRAQRLRRARPAQGRPIVLMFVVMAVVLIVQAVGYSYGRPRIQMPAGQPVPMARGGRGHHEHPASRLCRRSAWFSPRRPSSTADLLGMVWMAVEIFGLRASSRRACTFSWGLGRHGVLRPLMPPNFGLGAYGARRPPQARGLGDAAGLSSPGHSWPTLGARLFG
jgi:branched-subunit amino acid ABC-type transport system permease component